MPTRKAEGKMGELAKTKRAKDILLADLEAAALKTSGPDPDRRADVLHPSEMAKEDWCYRASYYRIKGNKEIRDEKFSFQMETIFDTGNEAHTKWQRRMRQTGKLWGDWQCIICKEWCRASFEPGKMPGCLTGYVLHIWEYKEVSLVSPDGLVQGHEDGAMCEATAIGAHLRESLGLPPGYMVEVKTIGTGTIRMDSPKLLSRHYKELVEGGNILDIDSLWKELSRPFASHVRQANIYLWLAAQMGLPFDKIRLLYELKHNSAVKVFVVQPSERIMKPILTGIEIVKYALEQGVPPECNQKDESGRNCKQCAAYEESSDAKTRSVVTGHRTAPGRPGEPSGGTAPRRRIIRRRAEDEGAGDRPGRVGEASPGEAPSRTPRRRDRDGRPVADAAVHEAEPLDSVPRRAGSGGPGRRVVRRKRRGEDEGR